LKAFVYTEYGPPDVLQLKDVEKPVPKDDEVLIRVHAVSLNSSDWEFLTGTPLYVRMWGLLKPKYKILGSDIAGRIEAVGRKVKRFQIGDEVLGHNFMRWGGFAEYVCAPENALVVKPYKITFEQAAAIPQSGNIAVQGLSNKVTIQPGQKVLINGAGGGAGSFTVQVAKLYGALVTGVDSTEKLDMMRSIGADHVVDYTKEDFTQNGQQYDLILDMVASHSISDYKRALSPNGNYLMVGGSLGSILNMLIFGSLISMVSSKKLGILAVKTNKDLSSAVELVEEGKIVPVIDRVYKLSEVPEALKYLGEGHAKGKVVITLEQNS
jgi:NADPH:quinone reductase-like Zn-dependent oxidoreductase